MRNTLRHSVLAAALVAFVGLAACSSDPETQRQISQLTGQISETFGEDAGSAFASTARLTTAAGEAMKKYDPQQEYEIGRAVGAQIVNTYPLYDEHAANRYVNLVGRLLAEHSDRPEVFAGYNFQVLDTDVVNAFAAPGAYIFVTRGMLRLCESEHELAAVLAHEVAHIEGQHAMRSIKQARWTQFATLAAKEGAVAAADADAAEAAELDKLFDDMVGDVTKTILVSGYSRDLERTADERGVQIMQRVGYDPAAMPAILAKLDHATHAHGPDFAATHPEPGKRVGRVNKQIGGSRSVVSNAAMTQRFNSALTTARGN